MGRGQPPHGLVGREQPDQGGGHTHDRHRPDEHRFTVQTVAEVAEDDSAQEPEDESDSERREGREGPRVGAVAGEEELGEDEGRDDSVEEEVIPFHDRPDE